MFPLVLFFHIYTTVVLVYYFVTFVIVSNTEMEPLFNSSGPESSKQTLYRIIVNRIDRVHQVTLSLFHETFVLHDVSILSITHTLVRCKDPTLLSLM